MPSRVRVRSAAAGTPSRLVGVTLTSYQSTGAAPGGNSISAVRVAALAVDAASAIGAASAGTGAATAPTTGAWSLATTQLVGGAAPRSSENRPAASLRATASVRPSSATRASATSPSGRPSTSSVPVISMERVLAAGGGAGGRPHATQADAISATVAACRTEVHISRSRLLDILERGVLVVEPLGDRRGQRG